VVFGARPTTAWRLQSPKRTVEVSVTGRIVADDFSLIRAAAISGAGIAWMPALIADVEVAHGRLERVLADYSTPGGQLYAVYPSARHVPAKVRAFVDFLAASLKERGG
jgi:DNA-binding transcriptional LysR family regulator